MTSFSDTLVTMAKNAVRGLVSGSSFYPRQSPGPEEPEPGMPPARSSSMAISSLRSAHAVSDEIQFEEESSEYDEYDDEDGSQFESTDKFFSNKLELLLDFQDLTYTIPQKDGTAHELPKFRGRLCRQNHVAPKSDRGPIFLNHENEDIRILHNISGQVKGGEIMAVMGPSGSGKTTLIDALAQRIGRGSLQGSISLNGEEVKNRSILRGISAYVMQDDLHFPMLTVRETLRFAAELRLPNDSVPKNERVEEVLLQLNLTKVANTIIGDETHRGISGGERKRVSIGKEVIHDPLILFLDEPTSGLDSANALLVISTLQRVADTGNIIILSVHQPSERLLKLMTSVLFIAEGQTIYRGSSGTLRDYFEVQLGLMIPDGTTTAEYALDLVQTLAMKTRTGGIAPLVQSFKRYSEQSELRGQTKFSNRDLSIIDAESAMPAGVRGALAASIAQGKLFGAATSYFHGYGEHGLVLKKFANSSMYEIYVLAWRGMLNWRRTPELFLMRFIIVMTAGFLLATIFWKLDSSPESLQERLGFYAFATSTTYYICVDTLPVFLQEKLIFMRETAHDSYRISSYVIAIALINIPFLFFLALAFAITTFWSVGLSGGTGGYFFFLLVIWSSFWAGNSFATLLSALVSNIITAYTIVVAALAYFLLLSGFFIAKSRIPWYWLWLHYLSVIKYPYEALLLNEFDRSDSKCYRRGYEILTGTPFQGSKDVADYVLQNLKPLLQSTQYRDLDGSTCLMTGASVLRGQNVGGLSKWGCLAVTIAFGMSFRLLFYVILRCTGKGKRH